MPPLTATMMMSDGAKSDVLNFSFTLITSQLLFTILLYHFSPKSSLILAKEQVELYQVFVMVLWMKQCIAHTLKNYDIIND